MNHAVVVDANVAVKWLLLEESSDRARALLQDSVQAMRLIWAPYHILSEVTNTISKHLRRRHITPQEAEQALRQFFQLPLQLFSSSELYLRAFLFTQTHRMTNTYDSQYVVLAQMLNTELWTDDRRLLNSVRAAAPWVRWIGDYPMVQGDLSASENLH